MCLLSNARTKAFKNTLSKFAEVICSPIISVDSSDSVSLKFSVFPDMLGLFFLFSEFSSSLLFLIFALFDICHVISDCCQSIVSMCFCFGFCFSFSWCEFLLKSVFSCSCVFSVFSLLVSFFFPCQIGALLEFLLILTVCNSLGCCQVGVVIKMH